MSFTALSGAASEGIREKGTRGAVIVQQQVTVLSMQIVLADPGNRLLIEQLNGLLLLLQLDLDELIHKIVLPT